MKGFVAGACCAIILLLGCQKNIQNTEAVRQGILAYLAKRPDLSAMDVSVGSVSFREDEADAVVSFRAKDGPPNNGMEMKYTLERKENRWEVKSRAGSGVAGNPHPSMPSEGPLHRNPERALPPGHPALPPQQTQPPLQ